jgi:hypothetical protein
MTEQKVVGGVPQNQMTAGDIVDYWGAIVGATSDGHLISWEGGSNELNLFWLDSDGSYSHHNRIIEDFAGRDLEYVRDYCDTWF